jgi:hypothetical protein
MQGALADSFGSKFPQSLVQTLRAHSQLVLLLVVFVGAISLSRPIYAQNTYGSAVGTISDRSGAVISGATVVLTNVDTGDKRTTAANSSGDYQFVNLLPGNYKLDVQNAGFKHFTRTNIVVQVQGSTRIDAALELGNVSETVEVTSLAPLVETQQATIGQVVAGRTLNELPLNGRNVLNLLAVTPGVVPQGQAQATNAAAGQGGNNFATGSGNYQISGGIPNTEAILVDGAPINTGYINSIAYVPAQDSVEEFRIEANNIGPEFGHTEDGIITMVTKSGTNSIRGTAYDYLRNTVLNSNTYFGDLKKLKKPVFIQNQFGFTAGGPIKKDRLFFFGSYEGIRVAVGSTSTYTVPTTGTFGETNEVGGDLSNFTTPITDPGQFDSNGNWVPNPPGTTFPGNIIPPGRINSSSKAMLAYWAAPNLQGLSNNYVVNLTTKPTVTQFIGRVDWNASTKHRIFAKYVWHHWVSPGADPYGFIKNPTIGTNLFNQVVLGDSYSLNPNTVLDFRLAYFRADTISTNENAPFDLSFLGWPSNTIANLKYKLIPRVAVSGYSNQGGGGQTIKPIEEDDSFSASVTKILGRHTLRFGGEFRRVPNDYGQTNQAQLEYFNFSNAFTGNALASYLLGLQQAGYTENAIFPAAMEYYIGAYLGDTFQVTNKLALNLGGRWEYPGYWTERHDSQTVWLPNAVNPLAAVTGLALKGDVALVNTPAYDHRTNLLSHYKLFSPRLGLAYRLTNSITIRSGFAILYAPTGAMEQNAQPYQSPVNEALTQVNSGSQPAASFSNPFPTGILQPVGRSSNYESVILGQPVVTSDPNEPATYVEQWNADLEQDLGHNTVLDVAYVANHGVHQQGPAGTNDNGLGLDQLPAKYFSMGAGALLAQVPNPFYGHITQGNLSGPTVAAGLLLRPYPQYYNLNNPAASDYGSAYNSLQIKIQKRFAQGSTLLGAYTLARNTGNADTQTGFQEGLAPGSVQDWTNLKAENSQMSYNIPQRAVISYVLDLPVGRGRRFLGNRSEAVDKAVAGWGLDGITTFQSGFPLVITEQPTYLSSTFGAGTPRPNVVASCSKKVGGSAFSKVHPGGATWFNTNCFTQSDPSSDLTDPLTFGNEPRVDPDLRMQGIANWDMAVFKQTAITERIGLQFRAEMFNSFNRVQFNYPNTVCCNNATDHSNSSFGVVSSQTNAPRQVQFALKLTY